MTGRSSARITRIRFDQLWWVGATAALLVVLVAAGCASGSVAPEQTGAGGTLSPSASVATETIAAASPIASAADADDETSAGAGASFAPSATGVPAPSRGAGPAERLPGEPDPALTPGALNPAVSQSTIHSTICVSGWTATIRPSESFTEPLKVKQIGQYGYIDTKTADYEEDHLISLELGGAPADPRNLWPEPYTVSLADGRPAGAHTKDTFETRLKNEVCAGSITLAQGQADIGDSWVHAYYGLPITTPPTTPAPTAAPTAAPGQSDGTARSMADEVREQSESRLQRGKHGRA